MPQPMSGQEGHRCRADSPGRAGQTACKYSRQGCEGGGIQAGPALLATAPGWGCR